MVLGTPSLPYIEKWVGGWLVGGGGGRSATQEVLHLFLFCFESVLG